MGQCKTGFNSVIHPILKEGVLITENNQKFMKFHVEVTEAELETWQRELQDLGKSSSLYILLPIRIQAKKEGFCGGEVLTNILYPCFLKTLAGQIHERMNQIDYFEEEQLWYILYMIIQAGSYVEKKSKVLGNIHPANIAFNEDGLVRVISKYSYINDSENQKFYSPEQLSFKEEKINQSLSQSYGIGLTILSAGILHICGDIYNSHSINREQLSEYLEIFGSKYSSYLYATVHSLLETSPYDRKTCGILKMKLEKFQEKIVQKKSFLPEHENRKKLNYKMNSSLNVI